MARWWVLAMVWCVGQAQVLIQGPCPNIPPMKGFVPKQFLGRWYEIERFFVSYEGLAGTCWVENYLHTPGRRYYTRLDWRDHLTGKVLNIENGLTFDKKEPARIHYVVQRPSIPILQGEYRILATDYDTYALAWQCDNLPLNTAHTEILWFLSKQQYPTWQSADHSRDQAAGIGTRPRRLPSAQTRQEQVSALDTVQPLLAATCLLQPRFVNPLSGRYKEVLSNSTLRGRPFTRPGSWHRH